MCDLPWNIRNLFFRIRDIYYTQKSLKQKMTIIFQSNFFPLCGWSRGILAVQIKETDYDNLECNQDKNHISINKKLHHISTSKAKHQAVNQAFNPRKIRCSIGGAPLNFPWLPWHGTCSLGIPGSPKLRMVSWNQKYIPFWGCDYPLPIIIWQGDWILRVYRKWNIDFQKLGSFSLSYSLTNL